MSYRKIGGLHFVRIWRFGASFYVTRRPAWVMPAILDLNRMDEDGFLVDNIEERFADYSNIMSNT